MLHTVTHTNVLIQEECGGTNHEDRMMILKKSIVKRDKQKEQDSPFGD